MKAVIEQERQRQKEEQARLQREFEARLQAPARRPDTRAQPRPGLPGNSSADRERDPQPGARDGRLVHGHPLRLGRQPAFGRHGLLRLHPLRVQAARRQAAALLRLSGGDGYSGGAGRHPARRPRGLRLPRAPRGHLHRGWPLHPHPGRLREDPEAEQPPQSLRHPALPAGTSGRGPRCSSSAAPFARGGTLQAGTFA